MASNFKATASPREESPNLHEHPRLQEEQQGQEHHERVCVERHARLALLVADRCGDNQLEASAALRHHREDCGQQLRGVASAGMLSCGAEGCRPSSSIARFLPSQCFVMVLWSRPFVIKSAPFHKPLILLTQISFVWTRCCSYRYFVSMCLIRPPPCPTRVAMDRATVASVHRLIVKIMPSSRRRLASPIASQAHRTKL